MMEVLQFTAQIFFGIIGVFGFVAACAWAAGVSISAACRKCGRSAM